MKKYFFIVPTFLLVLAALVGGFLFIPGASAAPAVTCYRDGCDSLFIHGMTGRGTEVLVKSETLEDSTHLDIGSVRLYHTLGLHSLHATLHLHSLSLIGPFTLLLHRASDGDTLTVATTGCNATTHFCDTPMLGIDNGPGECFSVALTWVDSHALQGTPQGVILGTHCYTN